jgi:predicted acylesterase/phospholipase RssA
VTTALVLGAGGMFAAWEVGAWRVLQERISFDLIVGASAGSWIGWSIACGATPQEVEQEWLDPRTAKVMQIGLHRSGWLRPEGLHQRARDLYALGPPRIPFALTLTEWPSLRVQVVRGEQVRWEHLAAACSIPFSFPPVTIDKARYVDGGFRGALPVWVAEEMGADRAIALNCLTLWPFRAMRWVMRPRAPSARFAATVIQPPEPLGPIQEGVVWSRANVERWIGQGAEDARRALSSVRM